MLQNSARLSPGGLPKREKYVKRILREGTSILKFRRPKMPEFLENGKIDNQLANSHTNAGSGLPGFKNSERKILQRKVRIAWNIEL